MRGETVAASASAIAAVASACAAIYALVFLSHQEDIAKNQLQATYLSNLYGKQVDAFSAMVAVEGQLFLQLEEDGILVPPNTPSLPDSKVIQSRLISSVPKYYKLKLDYDIRAETLKLLAPPDLRKKIEYSEDKLAQLDALVIDFAAANSPSQSMAPFLLNIKKLTEDDDDIVEVFQKCLQGIFSKGQPITDETYRTCNVSAR